MTDISYKFPKHEQGPQRGGYLPSSGQVDELLVTFDQAHESGCIQAVHGPPFWALMIATNLDPCNDCPVWKEDGPACKTFQMYHTAYAHVKESQEEAVKKATTPPAVQGHPEFTGLTTKQIAEKLGISKNEVRRRKAVESVERRSFTV